MTSLFVSTFTRLLRVELDSAWALREVSTVHEGEGIYFGLSSAADGLLAVARNEDPWGVPARPDVPSNRILRLLPEGPPLAALGRGTNVHQIRRHAGLLWVTTGPAPELRAYHLSDGRLVGAVRLSDLVPPDLQHPAIAGHEADAYHFNSLHFRDGALFVLAHNWHFGSFALELALSAGGAAHGLFAEPRLQAVHRGLGRASHDIFHDGEQLLALSGAEGRLVGTRGFSLRIGTEAEAWFPRGLAVGAERWVIGCGQQSEDRGARCNGPTHLVVYDPRSGRLDPPLALGHHGNTCALRFAGFDRTEG
ncbi:MAG: hypothetical protein ACT4PU_08695 [Planctomycetota bacterium]